MLDGIISLSNNYNLFLKTFSREIINVAVGSFKILNRYGHDNDIMTRMLHKMLAELSFIGFDNKNPSIIKLKSFCVLSLQFNQFDAFI